MKIISQIQFGKLQTKGYTIYNDISERLNDKKLKKVYIIAGVIKDEAYTLLEKDFDTAFNNGVEINFTIGVDRKTVSEQLARKIEKISSKSYMYNNNQEDSFNAKIYIFEYKNKAEVILPSTNLTANGITNNYSNITIISYDLPKDEELYNDYMFSIKEYIYPNLNLFDLIDDKNIKQYILTRDFALSKTVELPSISDYLKTANSMVEKIDEKEVEEKIKAKIKDIVTDFDVQLENDEFLFTSDEAENEIIEEEKVEKKQKKISIKTTKKKKEDK